MPLSRVSTFRSKTIVWPVPLPTETPTATEDPTATDDAPQMRQRAAESDVVIVNHHLLCADAAVRQSAYGEVIPDCHYAVVDEAHQLEDVATQYFGIAVSNYRIDDFARDVEKAVSSRMIDDADREDALRDDVEHLRDGARAFFGALQMTRFSSGPAGFGLSGTESRTRIQADQLEPVWNDARQLADALQAVESELASTPQANEDVLALARRASEIRANLKFLLRADDPTYVYFLEMRGRGTMRVRSCARLRDPWPGWAVPPRHT